MPTAKACLGGLAPFGEAPVFDGRLSEKSAGSGQRQTDACRGPPHHPTQHPSHPPVSRPPCGLVDSRGVYRIRFSIPVDTAS